MKLCIEIMYYSVITRFLRKKILWASSQKRSYKRLAWEKSRLSLDFQTATFYARRWNKVQTT